MPHQLSIEIPQGALSASSQDAASISVGRITGVDRSKKNLAFQIDNALMLTEDEDRRMNGAVKPVFLSTSFPKGPNLTAAIEAMVPELAFILFDSYNDYDEYVAETEKPEGEGAPHWFHNMQTIHITRIEWNPAASQLKVAGTKGGLAMSEVKWRTNWLEIEQIGHRSERLAARLQMKLNDLALAAADAAAGNDFPEEAVQMEIEEE